MDTPKKPINHFKQEGEFSHPFAFFERLDFLIRSFHNCMLNKIEIKHPVYLLYAELRPFLKKEDIEHYNKIMYNKKDPEDNAYLGFIFLLNRCKALGFTIPEKKEEYND